MQCKVGPEPTAHNFALHFVQLLGTWVVCAAQPRKPQAAASGPLLPICCSDDRHSLRAVYLEPELRASGRTESSTPKPAARARPRSRATSASAPHRGPDYRCLPSQASSHRQIFPACSGRRSHRRRHEHAPPPLKACARAMRCGRRLHRC
jgi:hypothetical protein